MRTNMRQPCTALSKSHCACRHVLRITVLCTQVATVMDKLQVVFVLIVCLLSVLLLELLHFLSLSLLPCITLLHISRRSADCIVTLEEPVNKTSFHISQTKHFLSTDNQSFNATKNSNRWVHFESNQDCVGRCRGFRIAGFACGYSWVSTFRAGSHTAATGLQLQSKCRL